MFRNFVAFGVGAVRASCRLSSRKKAELDERYCSFRFSEVAHRVEERNVKGMNWMRTMPREQGANEHCQRRKSSLVIAAIVPLWTLIGALVGGRAQGQHLHFSKAHDVGCAGIRSASSRSRSLQSAHPYPYPAMHSDLSGSYTPYSFCMNKLIIWLLGMQRNTQTCEQACTYVIMLVCVVHGLMYVCIKRCMYMHACMCICMLEYQNGECAAELCRLKSCLSFCDLRWPTIAGCVIFSRTYCCRGRNTW